MRILLQIVLVRDRRISQPEHGLSSGNTDGGKSEKLFPLFIVSVSETQKNNDKHCNKCNDIEYGEQLKKKNSKNQEKDKIVNKIKEEEKKDKNKYNNKKGNKQNKLQLQRLRKKKVMSYYFYKENIFFAVKISLILICFVSYFVVSLLVYKTFFNNYLDFDEIANSMDELYYQSYKNFLDFKSELDKFQSDTNYKMILPDGKDVQIPYFGNLLNEISQNKIYSQKNKNSLNQLYDGDMCILLFLQKESEFYPFCKEFLSSILVKGMEQAITQMGVLINSVINEISLVKDLDSFRELVKEDNTDFRTYDLFMLYYLFKAYVENEDIFDNLRDDQKKYYAVLTLEILIIYFIWYLFLFILMYYFIFRYKYIYTSLFNFCAILSLKIISDDDIFYQKLLELEKELYN